jgi:hypothetical protein
VRYLQTPDPAFRHEGVQYTDFIKQMASALGARSYLEIGTSEGGSLAGIGCDSVSVDPGYRINRDVIGRKKRAFFFQMTSDEFFVDHDLAHYLPRGVDLAFIDGMHRFEFVLRDFINAERRCHARSIILLHDCLPRNCRMAERVARIDESEAAETRFDWTGDVWRLLPALLRYRPDLRLLMLDCPPTGLVACTRLDPASTVLADTYHAIVDEFADLDLAAFGLDRLWNLLPMLSSRALLADDALTSIFTLS